MMLRALMDGLTIRVAHWPGVAGGDVRIADITEDSRMVKPGSLFVARRGERSDGRAFVPAAIGAGATAILTDDPELQLPAANVALLVAPDVQLAAALLAERFQGNPSASLNLIGVTGTNGKTTITFLIHQMMNAAGIRAGLIGTVCIDDGSGITPSSLTTPPAIELSRVMRTMADHGCRACVMETSSHALDQQRVGGLHYRTAVFTNLSHDHLDYHHTMDAYAAAKARLFQMLPADGAGGAAIINIDDPWAERMVAYTKARVIRCSMTKAADATARIVRADAASTTVEMRGPFAPNGWTVRVPMIGAHNVMNALQAATAAHASGVPAEAVRSGLANAAAPPGRMERVTDADAPFAVYVDYAHSDDSLRRVLEVARAAARAAGGRVTCVFGCGGDRDAAKRPKMGVVAAELADVVIVTNDNPRREDPKAIIAQIVAWVPASAKGRVTIEPDRRAAIVEAIAGARAGDVVLLAGKGHEDYQILPDGKGGTIKTHFDDREEARAALASRNGREGA